MQAPAEAPQVAEPVSIREQVEPEQAQAPVQERQQEQALRGLLAQGRVPNLPGT